MDYTTPLIKWLLKSEYVKKNKLFLNAATAQNNNIQIVTQQVSRNEDKEYVDGSILHKVRFTVFDFKSISFNQFAAAMLNKNENLEDLLSIGNITDFVKQKDSEGDFPDFGENFEVQRIYCEHLGSPTPAIDNSLSPPLAKYSIPITCEVLEYA